MKPPLESVNLAYFVPGIVALTSTYVALKGTPQGCLVAGQLGGLSSVGQGAVFLAFAYVVGYALWAVGDRLFRGRSDRRIFFWAVHYLGSSRPLRNYLLLNLYKAGHKDIAEEVARATYVEREQLEKLAETVGSPDCSVACRRRSFSEFKTFLSKTSLSKTDPGFWGRVWCALWVKPPENGSQLRRFCWDAIYNRANEYHVARMLSDWSNVKFAKSVCVSCVWAGAWIFARLAWELRKSCPPNDLIIKIYVWEVCGFAIAAAVFFLVVRWRLRVFARGFVHGLMPYSPYHV